MSDSPYNPNEPTPSSRPPEPPFGMDYQQVAPQRMADMGRQVQPEAAQPASASGPISTDAAPEADAFSEVAAAPDSDAVGMPVASDSAADQASAAPDPDLGQVSAMPAPDDGTVSASVRADAAVAAPASATAPVDLPASEGAVPAAAAVVAGAATAAPTSAAAPASASAWPSAQGASASGRAWQPDTSGVDSVGDYGAPGAYVPMGSPDATESFQAARFGDTGVMPRVESPQPPSYYTNQHANQYAGQQRQAPRPAAHATPAPAAATAAPAAKSSAGKTFLMGFLGALLACVLALGGFTLLNGGRTNIGASTVVGSTDQSVINAVDEGQTLAEAVAAKALPSVVAVYNYQNASSVYGYGYGYGQGYGTQGSDSVVATGMGSGVVISDDGYIVTNYHVVEGADKLTVTVEGAERDATYVGGDSSSDIAVVKVENTDGLKPADIGDSDSIVIGEWVMTVGAPLGLEQSVATGVVSATNRGNVMNESTTSDPYAQMFGGGEQRYTYYPNMIQTDAVINPGNSGGALVDADGKLIGINTMISSYSGDYAGVGFAIPVNYAISIARDVIDGKQPTHALLGVSLSQVNSQIAQRYNLSADKGAYISAITPNTGAADSDLQVGDIITAIDGKAITSVTDVTLNVRAHKVGDKVKVTVNRDGETLDVEVTLSSDENMVSANENQDQQQEQGQQDQRDQRGNGYGNGNGFSRDEIEELLKMLGM